MPSEYLILSLILMNMFQLWFWSKQVQVLVDKVKSTTYADYVQTKKKESEVPKNIKIPTIGEEQDDSDLKVLNGMLGRGR